MAEASAEISPGRRKRDSLGAGTHAAYFFDSHSEKQLKLFPLCKEIVDSKNAALIYIAGKQGVKGIRLSMKDVGFDLTPYEKSKQLKIVDSEEWFFSTSRQQKFKDLAELEVQLNSKATEALQTGFNYLAVISETDMLVRKGFLPNYLEFEGLVNSQLGRAKIAVVCAFDKRELLAAGVRDVSAEISRLHSEVL
jgi:hypothetical protein